MSGQITTLLNAGIDAFNNLWDVVITFPTAVMPDSLEVQQNYSVRAVSFSPPELSATTNQVDYKAVQLTRLMPKIQGERTFTLEFRMDDGYNIYKNLLKWKHIWTDPSGEGNVKPGALADAYYAQVTSNPIDYGQIIVKSFSSVSTVGSYDPIANTQDVGALWSFFDVVCTKVGSPSFQRSGSDFVTTTAEFLFGRMMEPWSSDLQNSGTIPTAESPTLTPRA